MPYFRQSTGNPVVDLTQCLEHLLRLYQHTGDHQHDRHIPLDNDCIACWAKELLSQYKVPPGLSSGGSPTYEKFAIPLRVFEYKEDDLTKRVLILDIESADIKTCMFTCSAIVNGRHQSYPITFDDWGKLKTVMFKET